MIKSVKKAKNDENRILWAILIINIVFIIAFPITLWMIYKISYHDWYNFLGGFIGGSFGELATLIAIVISTNQTRRIQEESKNFEIKKIKTTMQLEASRKQSLLIDKAKRNYSNLFNFLRTNVEFLRRNNCEYVDIEMYKELYFKLNNSVKELCKHFTANKYILNELGTKLCKFLEMLDVGNEKLFTWLETLESLINENYYEPIKF